MPQITYRLTGGLSREQLDQVRRQSLAVLETIGVEVDHEGIRKHLDDFEGVSIKGKRVCYAGELVETWIERIKHDNLEYSYNRPGPDAWRLVGPYMPQWFLDVDTGQQRYGTPDDLALSAQLMDAYGAYGPAPTHVQTVPEALRQLVTFKTCITHSREVGGYAPAANAFDAEYLCRLGQAARRPPPHGGMEIPISPLRLNHHALALIFDRRGRADQFTGLVYGGGSVPMPGATAPISMAGVLTQALAEALAAYITPKLIDDRIPGYCSFGGFLFDMKTMNTGDFFPESTIYESAVVQVLAHVLDRTFGVAFRHGHLATPADAFRCAFRLAMGALRGARTFLGAGSGAGETFAPHLFVVHADIMRHVKKWMQGLEFADDPQVAFEAIEHGVRGGTYLDHPSTLDYRTIYTEPDLFFKWTEPEALLAEARSKVREVLASHRFELPRDVERDVDDVYAAAVRHGH